MLQGRNLTHISIHPILFLDSAIVQICDLDKLLLVSNYAKCILCNTESEQFKQVLRLLCVQVLRVYMHMSSYAVQ